MSDNGRAHSSARQPLLYVKPWIQPYCASLTASIHLTLRPPRRHARGHRRAEPVLHPGRIPENVVRAGSAPMLQAAREGPEANGSRRERRQLVHCGLFADEHRCRRGTDEALEIQCGAHPRRRKRRTRPSARQRSIGGTSRRGRHFPSHPQRQCRSPFGLGERHVAMTRTDLVVGEHRIGGIASLSNPQRPRLRDIRQPVDQLIKRNGVFTYTYTGRVIDRVGHSSTNTADAEFGHPFRFHGR
jgi:hypothetical protein